MGRGSGCGCGGSQGLVVGKNGIDVAGAGIPARPWQPNLVKHPVFCEIVEDCASSFLCPGKGLVYDDAKNCLGVALSAKAGNDVKLGTDKGLYFAADPSPVDPLCGRTIEGLPPFVIGGLFGTGRNAITMGDDDDARGVVGAGLDLTLMTGRVGCDSSTWALVDALPTSALYTPTLPAGSTFSKMTAAEIAALAYNWGQFEGQPALWTECGLLTLDRWLDIIQGRTIGILQQQGETDAADQTMVRRLKARCAERQVIAVAANTPAIPRVWQNWGLAGFDIGVYVTAGGSPSVAELAPYPPARTWILIPATATDAVIRGYAQAGFQVLVYNTARRAGADRARSLGCRGVLSDDALYVKGGGAPLLRDPWCYDANPTGQVGHRDSVAMYAGATGYRFDDSASSVTQPPVLRGTCGWHTTKSPATGQQFRNAITPGWALPLPTWPSWEMTWLQLFDGFGGTSGGTGVIVCALDDRSPVLADGTAIDTAAATGYSALMMHATYGLQLRRMPSETGTPLAETNRAKRPDLNTWFRMRLRVSPSRIELTELDANSQPIAASTVASTDTTYRGRYMHFYKIQRQDAASTPWGRVDVAWRNWAIKQWDGVTP
ncbi:hypothetical protein AB0A05_27450 [Streptomyces sp. NPDC046374]|uniref:hypothetical protein n=1 Tax=Streptomyces sp. NPDC046374 TaxID=3154917 RepID=UPI0033D5AAD1